MSSAVRRGRCERKFIYKLVFFPCLRRGLTGTISRSSCSLKHHVLLWMLLLMLMRMRTWMGVRMGVQDPHDGRGYGYGCRGRGRGDVIGGEEV